MSPSAFIPFCDFGGNMSAMGKKIDQFDIPICSSCQATMLNDQLCYEVDLNEFSNKVNIDNELRLGFSFIMDYNEDRQVFLQENQKITNFSLVRSITDSAQNEKAVIYLSTIGKAEKKLLKHFHDSFL